MDRDRLPGISVLCSSLCLALVLYESIMSVLSNPISLGLWLILALVGIVILFGFGFAMLLWPSRYSGDELSRTQNVLLFIGTVFALAGAAVLIL